jgi:hypothetical protein
VRNYIENRATVIILIRPYFLEDAIVPLNQLYFDHQLSLIRVEEAPGMVARQELELGASLIAGRIACIQRATYAAAAPAWEALAAPALLETVSRSS